MITATVAIGILTLFAAVLTFLPPVTSLPFGIDGTFYTVGHWILQIQTDFWPLDIVFRMFFLFYLPFLLTSFHSAGLIG